MTQELAGNLIIQDGKVLLLYRDSKPEVSGSTETQESFAEDKEQEESQRSQEESCSTNNPEGWWEMPGGKVGKNESPTEAAVRKVKEDIGVKASLEKPFYSGEFQKDDRIFLWHCYKASIEGEPEIKEEKFERLEWFKASELDDIELAPSIEMILPALRKI